MKKNFTLFKILINFLSLCALLLLSANTLVAQVSCKNANVLWAEDFGTGTTATTSPNVLASGLFYQESGSLASEGSYRVINNLTVDFVSPASEMVTTRLVDVTGKQMAVENWPVK